MQVLFQVIRKVNSLLNCDFGCYGMEFLPMSTIKLGKMYERDANDASYNYLILD